MAMKITLTVEKGGSPGRTLTAEQGTLTIGRSPGASLSLSGDEFVSNQHAALTQAGEVWSIQNSSPNGTLVNGRPVVEATLQHGDRISVGLQHLIAVTLTPTRNRGDAAAPAAGGAAAAAQAKAVRRRLPTWMIVYFGVMTVAFIALLVSRVAGGGEASLADLIAQEQSYATANGLAAEQTERVLRLLDTATVHERRGDDRSAYEAYREVLGARDPIAPRSPAYRYAASRVARLGPK